MKVYFYIQQQKVVIIQIPMKSTKNKILHKSFLTNQDLIHDIRNQSYVSTRQATSRMHTERSKITLIKKKSFDRMHTEQQNSCYVNNVSFKEPIGTPMEKAVFLLQDCITSLGDQNQKIQHKLRKVLKYIREVGENQHKSEQNQKIQKQEIESIYLKQIQREKEECSKLRKMNEDLKMKIMDYREKVLSFKKQSGLLAKKDQQPSGLQQIIINQSQIIDKQCDQYNQQNNQMRRMLKTQALKLEEMLKKQPQKGDELRLYTSLQNSFIFKH